MADTRRLTVEPTGGLGNRLRVIDAAIGLSRELSHWSSFSELAAEIGGIPLQVIDAEADRFPQSTRSEVN